MQQKHPQPRRKASKKPPQKKKKKKKEKEVDDFLFFSVFFMRAFVFFSFFNCRAVFVLAHVHVCERASPRVVCVYISLSPLQPSLHFSCLISEFPLI
jgi:hypothetical protein